MSAAIQQHIQHKVVTARAEKGAQPGTHVFTLSTDKPDRDGDRLNQGGWDLTAYRQNPVVLYGHDARGLPIGKCTDIRVVGGKLKGTIEWPPPGAYPFADQVHALVDGGFLNAASVGFRINSRTESNQYGGRDISSPELCEWSIVPIPSNTDATLERSIDHVRYKNWLGTQHDKEDSMQTEEKWLEVTDDFFRKDFSGPDWFDFMLAQMRQNVPADNEYRLMMEAQMATLGPNATIADLCRGMMAQGVVAPPKSFDIDERELAVAISRVVAGEIGNQTRAALNAALGRLD